MTGTTESRLLIGKLVDGLIARDDSVWRKFLVASGPFINGVCRKHGLDHDEIEDISQTFVLRLIENDCRILRSASFDSINGFYGWAKVVMTRIILDYIRKGDSRKAREQVRGRAHLKKSLAADGAAELEFNMKVEEITSQLTKQEHTTFWFIYNGLKSHEIARISGLTTVTIQKRVSRLKKKLRELMCSTE